MNQQVGMGETFDDYVIMQLPSGRIKKQPAVVKS